MSNFFDNMDQWSSDEEETSEPLTFETAIEVTLGFGKHRGESIGTLLRTTAGRAYMRWCLANFEKLFDDTRAAMELALSEFEKAKASRG